MQRTDKDRDGPATTGRHYRLSPAGLAALRANARAVQRWRRSTGPRTAAGKPRASRNAVRYGLRSADADALRRAATELRQLLHALGG
jgi:hypothetical protein